MQKTLATQNNVYMAPHGTLWKNSITAVLVHGHFLKPLPLEVFTSAHIKCYRVNGEMVFLCSGVAVKIDALSYTAFTFIC